MRMICHEDLPSDVAPVGSSSSPRRRQRQRTRRRDATKQSLNDRILKLSYNSRYQGLIGQALLNEGLLEGGS